MTKQKWMLYAAGLALLLFLAACGASNDNDANNGAGEGGDGGNGTTTAAADAEEIYKDNCVTCHGADLKGQNLATVGSRLNEDEIANKIRSGGGGMIAFDGRLDDSEIEALADWLSAKK